MAFFAQSKHFMARSRDLFSIRKKCVWVFFLAAWEQVEHNSGRLMVHLLSLSLPLCKIIVYCQPWNLWSFWQGWSWKCECDLEGIRGMRSRLEPWVRASRDWSGLVAGDVCWGAGLSCVLTPLQKGWFPNLFYVAHTTTVPRYCSSLHCICAFNLRHLSAFSWLFPQFSSVLDISLTPCKLRYFSILLKCQVLLL